MDYNVIAEVLNVVRRSKNEQGQESIDLVATELAESFATDPSFDFDTFVEAAGTPRLVA